MKKHNWMEVAVLSVGHSVYQCQDCDTHRVGEKNTSVYDPFLNMMVDVTKDNCDKIMALRFAQRILNG